MSTLAAESQLGLQTVGNAADDEYLLIALRILLSVEYIIYGGMRQFGCKRQPLFGRQDAIHTSEVVVGIRTCELKRVVDACHLERRVVNKLVIERQERRILAVVHTGVDHRCHHPLSAHAIEHKLTHMMARQIDALHHYMAYRCVLDNIHLTHIVENKRVEILMHKEMLHLPTLLRNERGVVAIDYRQRENDALHLQLTICREVEEEVVEQFVSRLWHRSLGYNLIQSVGHRIYTVSTDTVRIGHHRRLLV